MRQGRVSQVVIRHNRVILRFFNAEYRHNIKLLSMLRAIKKGREFFYTLGLAWKRLLFFALWRVVFQFAHADAGVSYNFYVAAPVCLYYLVVSNKPPAKIGFAPQCLTPHK